MAASLATDSSVAVPLLVADHPANAAVSRWRADRRLVLAGHALAETYSVLTRLPGDLRCLPADAARLLNREFGTPLPMRAKTFRRLAPLLSEREIAGGAVFDALVGLAAVDNDLVLASRDARARRTYEAVGATVEFVAT